MKETKKSLKIYFIALGVFNLLYLFFAIVAIFAPAEKIKEYNFEVMDIIIGGILSLVFACFFLYYGIKLYDYLQRSPKILINFVIINGLLSVINGILSLNFLGIIVSILISWYLVSNIKKLSSQNITNEISVENKK